MKTGMILIFPRVMFDVLREASSHKGQLWEWCVLGDGRVELCINEQTWETFTFQWSRLVLLFQKVEDVV